MGEVIKFPKTSELPQTHEDLMETWTATRMMYCDELVNTFFSKFATQLNQVGFPVEDKDFFLRFITASELMRSVLYDAYGLSHPHFKTVVETMEKTKELVKEDGTNPFATDIFEEEDEESDDT